MFPAPGGSAGVHCFGARKRGLAVAKVQILFGTIAALCCSSGLWMKRAWKTPPLFQHPQCGGSETPQGPLTPRASPVTVSVAK